MTVVCDYATRSNHSDQRDRFVSCLALSMAICIIYVMIWPPKGLSFGQYRHTKEDRARAAIGFNGPLLQGLEMFKFQAAQYPAQLRDLVRAPQVMPTPKPWTGPYLHNLGSLIDPWGHEYQYRRIAKAGPTGLAVEAHIWSIGPDGIDQTPDDIHGP